MLFCYNSLTPIYNTSGPHEHSQVVWSKGEFVKWYGFCSVWKCICIIIIRKQSPVTQCRPDIHVLLIQPWQCNIPLLPWCTAYITAARQLAMKVCNVAYIAIFHITNGFIAIQFSYFVAGKRDWVQLALFFFFFYQECVRLHVQSTYETFATGSN